MQKLFNVNSPILYYWKYFHLKLGHRIYSALVLSVMVGVLDGFGLAMFLPLLELIDENSEASFGSLGNLEFVLNNLKELGLVLNLTTILLLMLLFFVLKGLAKFWEIYYRVKVQQFFIKKLRFENIDLLSNYQYESFVSSDAGRIQNTLSGETERVASAYRFFFMSIQMGAMLIVYLILAFIANPQFALLIAISGLISNQLIKFIYQRTKNLSRRITEDNHHYQGLLIQKVTFFKYLKATGSIYNFADKLKNKVKIIEHFQLQSGYLSAVIQSIREPLAVAMVVLVILVQLTFFNQALGLIILSLLFFYRSMSFLLSIETSWNSFLNVSGSLQNNEDFQGLLMNGQEIKGNIEYEGFNESIEFKDVSFKYGQKQLLKKVNFKLLKNQSYAIIGESGAGKTTLVNLVAGLIKPSEGQIFKDGIPYEDLDLTSFQKRIGYITQEPVIFNDSIFNNVTMWADRNLESENKFWQVLKQASIFELVSSQEKKEEALLGNNGLNLSGGQRQRIAIARELYKEIDLLILDEATSALDDDTESILKMNLGANFGKLTVIIISHKPSVHHYSSIIFKIEGGTLFPAKINESLAF
jgi:ABC-type multidrug transport system fused ATPase/permease subunit